jgi:integrase/recombinase XerD
VTYLTKDELRRLFGIAYRHDRRIHLLLVIQFWSGLRISETLNIRGRDVCDNQLHVKRLKKSRPTVHQLHVDSDPLFDASPIIELAASNRNTRLFDYSPQWINRLLKRYAALAGIHSAKCHTHVLKHSICMALWDSLKDLSAIQDYVGHKSASSTLVYMRHDATVKAQNCIAAMSI